MQAFRTQIIKINSASLRNSCMRLSADAATKAVKPEPSLISEAVAEAASPPPAAEEAVGNVVSESATTAAINVAARYNVVSERTFGGFTKPLSIAELNHKFNNDHENLQPCNMREFHPGCQQDALVQFPKGIDTRDATAAFAESKTRANLTLPLKAVRLASPFPEPVKVMMSNTMSDEEKAQQMLAESKGTKSSTSDWTGSTALFARKNYSTLNNGIIMKPETRYYTTKTRPLYNKENKKDGGNEEKCKKLGQKPKKACPKYTLHNCPSKARESCDEGHKVVICKKQDAPYPAYSEFCHEDVIDKPSECVMCPWSTDKHPTFKPPKRKLHFSRVLASRRTGLERLADRIKAAKEEVAALTEAAKAMEAPGSIPGDVSVLGDLPKTPDDGMQCDLRKPACKRPPRKPCVEKKPEKTKKKPKPKKEKKCDGPAVAANAQSATEEDAASELVAENLFNHKLTDRRLIDGLAESPEMEAATKKKGGKKGKCKKLPFVPFDSPKRSPRLERNPGGCPKKPKKPLVIDCPPDENVEKCTSASNMLGKNMEVDPTPLSMSSPPKPYKMEYKMKKKRDDKKCPKVELTMNREDQEDDDPCKPPKKKEKECPTDLLPIKRRIKRPPPRKKVSSITPIPVELPLESTHHQHPKM